MLRDLIFAAVVCFALPICFRRPLIGVYLFSWLAYMRPQDLCWGFAREQRWSFLTAVVTIAGFVSQPGAKQMFIRTWRTWAMIGLAVWVGLSLFSAWLKYPEDAAMKVNMYVDFLKIIGVALFTTAVVVRREHLRMLMWIIALSFGFYGVKVGLAGVLSFGRVQVLQGPGGMLEDNNNFALALNMSIPLLLQLGQSESNKILRRGIHLMIPLTGFAVIMTHSRGGFLTLAAILCVLVWRSRNRVAGFSIGAAIAVLAFFVVPDSYKERIGTISDYENDGSSMGRLAAWKTALNMSAANPVFGVGYDTFQWRYSQYASGAQYEGRRVAHNAYLQVLAECGMPALGFYLFLIFATIWCLWRLRRDALKLYNSSWIINYATMFETSMIAFVVGSTFLNRAQFDLLYHFIAIVVAFEIIARRDMQKLHVRDDVGRGRSGELRVVQKAGFTKSAAARGPLLSGGPP